MKYNISIISPKTWIHHSAVNEVVLYFYFMIKKKIDVQISFNQIDFDYENKSILLHTVYNAGEVIFADKIESVLVDGDDYSDFDSHILNTLEGKHTYHVFLK